LAETWLTTFAPGFASSTEPGIEKAPSKSAICCKAAACVAEKAEGREENTSTTPAIEPCARIATAKAERKCKLSAIDGRIRKSASASSQSTTVPVSRHSLVKAESGCSREPTAGASPVLATQRTPCASRSAMKAPPAHMSEHSSSTTLIKTADLGWSSFTSEFIFGLACFPSQIRFGHWRPPRGRVGFAPEAVIENALVSRISVLGYWGDNIRESGPFSGRPLHGCSHRPPGQAELRSLVGRKLGRRKFRTVCSVCSNWINVR
jgi:hypothetical protein